MSQVKTSVVIDLIGNISQRAAQFTGSLQRMGSNGSRSMQMLGRSVDLASRGLDRLGNRYTTLLGGAAGLGALKMVADLEERFTRLGIDAGKSAEEISGLKKEIYEIAKAPEIRVDPGEITSAIEEIIQKTGDLKFAQTNIRNIGLAIKATGAQGKDIGGIMAEFQKMGIIDPSKTLEALDTLVVQGKEGAFTLKELAALGPRVITAYTSKGRGGVAAIREMGAALQMIRMGTGNSEQAATAFENVMKTFTDVKKLKILQAGGIKVFDPEAAKQGKEILRPVNELMAEIILKTKGKGTLLGQVFDAEAIRAFNQAAGEFQRTGKLDSLDRFYKIQADGTTITKDSIRAAKTANAAMTNLLSVWKQFADNQLAEPIKRLTEYMDDLKPGTVERWLKVGSVFAAVLGGAVVVNQLAGAARLMRGGRLGGALGNQGMGAGGAPIPVYVVNNPNLLPGAAGGGGAAAAARGIGLAGGTAIALPLTVALASRPIAKALAERELKTSSNARLQQLLSQHLVLGGGPATYQAKLIANELQKRGSGDVNGTIKLVVEQDRVRVKEMKSHGINIDVDTGLMMGH